jgi:pyruvate dehydrogenase E1 component alpha subunit
VPQYRELAGQLWHGYPLRLAFLWHVGHPIAFQIPEGLNMLPFQAAIAGQLPQAVGLAWGLRMKRDPGVVLAVFGDGGTSQGDFHEAANLAGVMKAPIVLLCQNNGWAISTTIEQQTASATLAQKASSYGFDGVRVDGMDALAVFGAVRSAVAKAREGGGPTMVEALTYRLGPHSSSDDPSRYRDEKEVAQWRARDPLPKFRRYLERQGWWDEAREARLEQDLGDEITHVVAEAEKIPPPSIDTIFADVYDEMPWNLIEERGLLGGR